MRKQYFVIASKKTIPVRDVLLTDFIHVFIICNILKQNQFRLVNIKKRSATNDNQTYFCFGYFSIFI